MNLYEVIRWGNQSDDPFTGGPDGADTCFLVRADSVEEAAELADEALRRARPTRVSAWVGAVYLLGMEHSTEAEPRLLRGPYLQHAYCYGWRQWCRDEARGPWVEQEQGPLVSEAEDQRRTRLGSLLAEIGRSAQLSDEEFAILERAARR